MWRLPAGLPTKATLRACFEILQGNRQAHGEESEIHKILRELLQEAGPVPPYFQCVNDAFGDCAVLPNFPQPTRREIVAYGSGLIVATATPDVAAGAPKSLHKTSHYSAGNGGHAMSRFTTRDGTEIYYNDWGTGKPIVFSHGWPLSADAFEDRMFFLAQHGYRCIAHDRRGHGRSSQPWSGCFRSSRIARNILPAARLARDQANASSGALRGAARRHTIAQAH
jgi:hypothetical protein